jgi:tetratricopeptide (TPR) repeat protein
MIKKQEDIKMSTKLKFIAAIVLCAGFSFAASKSIAQNLEIAKSYTLSERFEDAQNAFEALLKAQPANGDVFFFYGENFLYEYFSDTVYGSEKASAADALRYFKSGVAADSNNPICYVGIGKVALMLKDVAEAEKYFAKAQSKFPSKANKTSTVTPEKQALTLAKIAEAYVLIERKKNIPKALVLLEKAVTLDPKNPDIYLIYGDAYIEGNDGSNAISQYKMAQELNPKSPSAKLRLGNLWIRAKNYTEAITYYKEGIDIDSTFAPAYLELGKLYSKASQLDKSLYYFKKYDEMSTNISAKIKYVNVLMESKKYDEAIKKLDEISKSDTSRNDLNRAYAICYYETTKYDKALISSEKFFTKTTPEKIKFVDFSYYGKTLSKNSKDSLAIIAFLKAYDLDTTNYDVLSDIAASYNKMKKYKEAAYYYKLKLSKPNEKPRFADNYKYGMVEYNLGQTERNIDNWKKSDSTFKVITEGKPDFMNGKAFFYRAIINSMIDTLNNTQEAKPLFEKYITYGVVDSVKNKMELISCYDYLAYQYYKIKDFCNARMYWQKMLFLDPKNAKALDLLKETNGKCPTEK